jgi:hypothetical protein
MSNGFPAMRTMQGIDNDICLNRALCVLPDGLRRLKA